MPLLTEPKELRLPAIRTEETKAAFDGYVGSLGWRLTILKISSESHCMID